MERLDAYKIAANTMTTPKNSKYEFSEKVVNEISPIYFSGNIKTNSSPEKNNAIGSINFQKINAALLFQFMSA